MSMDKTVNFTIFFGIAFLSLVGSITVSAQDIIITDTSQYPSTGIDASRYDDKLIGNTLLIDIKENKEIRRFVSYGAKSDKNDKNYDLHGNKTYIKNGKFSDVSIYGSASIYRFVDNNSIQIDDGVFRRSYNGINGGYSIEGTVYKNRVLINNGDFDSVDISGGYSQYGSISKNNVTINDGIFKGYSDIYGGNSKDIGIVSDNSVVINKVTEGNFNGIYGGFSARGLVARNNVTINTDVFAYDVIGGYGDHDNLAAIYGNSVNINDSDSIIYKLAGGYNYKGNAFDNVVDINNSVLNYSSIYGGMTRDGNTNRNTIIINKSTISGDIIGGYAGGEHNSYDNVIEIIDSNVKGQVFGGYSDYGTASNNTIVLYGIKGKDYDMSGANITGGYSGIGVNENNKLVIDSWQGNVNNINKFDEIVFGNLNFIADSNVINITGGLETNLSNTKITGRWISFGLENPENHIGESIHLIKNENGIIFNEDYDEKVKIDFQEGLTHDIYGELYNNKDNKSVDFTINGRKQSGQLKLMTYNRNIGMALVNQGSDLLNDIFIMKKPDEGENVFAAMQGNFSRYEIGGDANVNGWSGLVGISDNKKFNNGIFTYGIFYENGMGNYSDYNQFNNEYLRFDGSAVYNGGGVLARYNFTDGVYTQAAFRLGKLKNELQNGLYDNSGKSYGYINENNYYGADFSIGKVFELNNKLNFDIYSNFSYTHFDDSTFSITGDSFTNDFYFGNVESKKLKVGSRIIQNIDNKSKFYYGAAYEYEFDGRTNISTKGEYVDDDGGLKGCTLVGELGVSYSDLQNSNFEVNANLRGYAGNRDGISVNVEAMWSF